MASVKPLKHHLNSTTNFFQQSKRRLYLSTQHLLLNHESASPKETKQPAHLYRQSPVEMAQHSPYAARLTASIPRSKSMSKAKVKQGKQVTPERRLDRLRTDLHLESKAKRKLHASLALSFSSLPSEESHREQLPGVRKVQEGLLKSLADQTPQDWKEEIKVCNSTLQQLATLDITLGSILDRVRTIYDSHILQLSHQLQASQLELTSVQTSLSQEIEGKQVYKSKLEQIVRENVELSQACEAYQSKCFEYQEKLFDVACVELDQFPPNEKTWRLLISELETYKSWKETAVKEFKIAHSKEKKLVELIQALKKRGYPVEEVYRKDVKKKVDSERSSQCSSSSEAELLVTGPALVYPRPEYVPALQLQEVSRDVSSVETSQSSSIAIFMKTVSSSTSDVTSEQGKSMPELHFPVQNAEKMYEKRPRLPQSCRDPQQ